MSARGWRTIVTAVVGAAAAWPSTAAAALSACTVAQIAQQDPGCPPGAGACSITKVFNVGDGCVLDFDDREVAIAASGELAIGSGSVTLKAAGVTIAPGGLINGRGPQSSGPGSRGGSIDIISAGSVAVRRSSLAAGRVDVSGFVQAGAISVTAGGVVGIDGKLNADKLSSAGVGGRIILASGADIVGTSMAVISAAGGEKSTGGGSVRLSAAGSITLDRAVDVSGHVAGDFDARAAGAMSIRGVQAVGTGDGGDGGSVDLVAGAGLQVLGPILARGAVPFVGDGGGMGGTVLLQSQGGGVVLAANVIASGAEPDGDGGEVIVLARDAVDVGSEATVSARANGGAGAGGTVTLDAGTEVRSAGVVDSSGGSDGGEIEMSAGSGVTQTGRVDASGRNAGAMGGMVSIEAGKSGEGSLSIGGTIDVDGGPCGTESGCGMGGETDLSGCDVTVTSTGSVLARAYAAGVHFIEARARLSVLGPVKADSTAAAGSDGENRFTHLLGLGPVIGAGMVVPPPVVEPLPACATAGEPDCLSPCAGGVLPTSTPTPPHTATAAAASPTPSPPLLPSATATRTPSAVATRTPVQPATATRTATPTMTPSSMHDSVILPPRPIQLTIGPGIYAATREVRLRVTNADVVPVNERPGHAVRVIAEDGDCPLGTVAGAPDFDRAAAEAQETAVLAGGQSRVAVVPVTATRRAFEGFNRKTPVRCTLVFRVEAGLIGNQDPTPANNIALVELDVVDLNDPDRTAAHESFAAGVRPARVVIGRGIESGRKVVTVGAGNGDLIDAAGHAITVTAEDGDCPPGIAGSVAFPRDRVPGENVVGVSNGKVRDGRLRIAFDADAVTTPNPESPFRCTALVRASGPAGDSVPGNDSARLVIDVIDRNDF